MPNNIYPYSLHTIHQKVCTSMILPIQQLLKPQMPATIMKQINFMDLVLNLSAPAIVVKKPVTVLKVIIILNLQSYKALTTY